LEPQQFKERFSIEDIFFYGFPSHVIDKKRFAANGLKENDEVDFEKMIFPDLETPAMNLKLIRYSQNKEGYISGLQWEYTDGQVSDPVPETLLEESKTNVIKTAEMKGDTFDRATSYYDNTDEVIGIKGFQLSYKKKPVLTIGTLKADNKKVESVADLG